MMCTTLRMPTHTYTYIDVSGTRIEWIYVAGAACVVTGKAGHTKALL